MSGRYAAFTFVDRITVLEPGVAARGTFHIPTDAGTFPSSLLAEATGQLAAWIAVDRLGFRLRPVAGIAHETLYYGEPAAGDTIETAIRIDSCEDDAVAYQGVARIGGKTVLELHDCVGPMLPLEGFDDPESMRSFFETLCTMGAPPDRFEGIEPLPLVMVEHDHGRRASAVLDVPTVASFFEDHFPRHPVYPGTLLLDRLNALAARIVSEAHPGRVVRARRVSNVKLRSFTTPGTRLELRAAIDASAPDSRGVLLEARAEGQQRPVGGAYVEFEVGR